jgi:hypothetical protein
MRLTDIDESVIERWRAGITSPRKGKQISTRPRTNSSS